MGIPRRIGSIRPFAELARSATTSVLKAHDSESGEVVVVKLLRREWATDSQLAARFASEAAALRSVSNQNVVTMINHGECEEGLFIVTEYVEGVTLDELIRVRTIPSAIGAFIVRESLVGLQAVHSAGIIHQDFKAANIVVGEDGLVKLMDFGFAESLAKPSAGTKVTGTVGYIAPEMLAGESPSFASDCYSAGITLLEASTGSRVRSAEPSGTKTQLATPEFHSDSLAQLDPDLVTVIRKMTGPSPLDRPQHIEDAIRQLDQVLASYRPVIDRSVLARWLQNEPQTLPRRLMKLPEVDVPKSPGDRSFNSAAVVNTEVGTKRRLWYASAATVAATLLILFAVKPWNVNRDANPDTIPGQSSSSVQGEDTQSRMAGADQSERNGFEPQEGVGSADLQSEILAADAGAGNSSVVDPPQSETSLIEGSVPEGSPLETSSLERSSSQRSSSQRSLPDASHLETSLSEAASSGLQPDSSLSAISAGSSDGRDLEQSREIDPLEMTGQTIPAVVSIAASPWADIVLDGELIGTTPLQNNIAISPGEHTVVFINPNFPKLERQITVEPGDSTVVSVSMWSTVARLNLAVSPWAEVLIDGVVRDTIPMSAPLILPPGELALTLRHPELGSYTETLLLQADSTYSMQFNLFELTR